MVRSAIRPLLAPGAHARAAGAEGAGAAERDRRVLVVVGAEPGKARVAERLVRRAGGKVGRRIAIVHGFTARVPAGSLARLRRASAIRMVARDAPLRLSSVDPVAIDPPPAQIPTDVPADEAAREVIRDAAHDAAAGDSLAPDPVAAGEDVAPASQDAATDPAAPVGPTADDGPLRARESIDSIRAATGVGDTA